MSEQKTTTGASEVVYVHSPFPDMPPEDEIDLFELWQVIWAGRRTIFITVFAATLLAVAVSLYLPKIYKSSATLLPAQHGSSSGRLSSLLGSLPISLPGIGGGGEQSNIMVFLQSIALKKRLLNKYNLLAVLFKDSDDPPTVVGALQNKVLSGYLKIDQDKKTNLITISWSDKDPKFCRDMVLRVIKELDLFLTHDYVSKAKKQREFVEGQLAKATAELERWERQIPTKEITASRITRERLSGQAVYTELRKQLELAKIAEARELESFEVIDKPFIPERKDRPKRALIVVLSSVTATFAAVMFVFIRAALRKRREESEPGGDGEGECPAEIP